MVDVRPEPTEVARIIDDTLVLFEGRAAEKGRRALPTGVAMG
jgi:hypothetical protein